MNSYTRNRHIEELTYLGLWLMVILLSTLGVMRSRSSDGLSPIDAGTVLHMTRMLVPFFILFAINNWILVPRLLFRNRLKTYFLCATLATLLIWGWQYHHFIVDIAVRPAPHHMHRQPPHILPLPLYLDLIFELLIVGVNLAIALLFQRFRDRLERERLMKSDAENRLNYLKAQINPHFYMNMLNNIHGMIEVDPEKAQEMVIDMSRLMRYMLYDSSNNRISLSAEIEFLDNYVRLMRIRYPEDRVSITMSIPDQSRTAGVMVPPLIFLVFIENAFKHGISYREMSYVSISIEVSDESVKFICINSNHPTEPSHKPGIGLHNVCQRLRLIYGNRYTLTTTPADNSYSVTLNIPAHETENTDSRR